MRLAGLSLSDRKPARFFIAQVWTANIRAGSSRRCVSEFSIMHICISICFHETKFFLMNGLVVAYKQQVWKNSALMKDTEIKVRAWLYLIRMNVTD